MTSFFIVLALMDLHIFTAQQINFNYICEQSILM